MYPFEELYKSSEDSAYCFSSDAIIDLIVSVLARAYTSRVSNITVLLQVLL